MSRKDRLGRPANAALHMGAVITLLGAACTGSGSGGSADPLGLPAELEIAEVVELRCAGSANEPTGDLQRVLDVVALPAAPDFPNALQLSAREAEDGPDFYFAKTGLWWRADAGFELIVPTELRSVMAIGWGGPAEMTHRVQLDCDPDAESDWLVLAGGFWVSEPMCAELIVEADGVEERVEIGLGQPCPGQEPPAGPSDGPTPTGS